MSVMRVMVLHPHAKFEVFPFRRCGTFSVSELIGLVTLTFDLLTLKVVYVRVTCDVGYLCANFGLPRPLCSRLISPMYATDRSTSGKSIA